jgi:iron complex transport system ATP-binding protein
MSMSVQADGVVFAYPNRSPVLKSVGLELNGSEVLGIVGPNGSGKTTFLKCLNRILAPSQGEILLHDRDVTRMSRREIARSVGYVPQSSNGRYAEPTVFEVVLMGRRPHVGWRSSQRDEETAWRAIERLNLGELATTAYDQLSGGEKQKVLIARALAQEARVLLLDEPTSSLDIFHQLEVMALLRELAASRSLSVCVIVHDLDLAIKYCDRVVMMKGGEVFAAGPASDVITEASIRDVYGVRAVIDQTYGRPHVVVL